MTDKINKISIRFFNDWEVRAAWDDVNSRWLFSVVDVIAILTDSKNPSNYWKVMKHRFSKASNELVTKCNQLKMVAVDGKSHKSDVLDSEVVIESMADSNRIKSLVKPALTSHIDDREMFIKGIDYSYYYEQDD